MLFNSIQFALYFLPATVAGFYFLKRWLPPRGVQIYLILISLLFYGLWEVRGLYILLFSITVNYLIGHILVRTSIDKQKKDWLFYFIVLFNVFLLGYYKYTLFILDTIAYWTDADLQAPSIILPLAISFFTFTQIAFQVDAHRGEVRGLSFIEYVMFVTFFPHLVAGPIYHHKEMMPQFERMARAQVDYHAIVGGLAMFAIGLFKKIVFADNLAPYADQAFSAAAGNWPLTLLEAWGGILAFGLQIYFDFSGYSDMAIGLALILNVRLPVNFNSPLKATSIIDIWRRWHMTLVRFLNDYIFLPLALTLSRLVSERRAGKALYFLVTLAIPLTITFTVSGLWHGAGWTYVMFGVVTGIAMSVNYAWRKAKMPRLPSAIAWIVTMLTFLLSLLFFRAESMSAAMLFLGGLMGRHGVALPVSAFESLGSIGEALKSLGWQFDNVKTAYLKLPQEIIWIVLAGVVVVTMPNSQEILERFQPTLESGRLPKRDNFYNRILLPWAARFFGRLDGRGGAFLGASLAVMIVLLVVGQSWFRDQLAQFIYFQF